MNINNVCVIGRITKDIELRTTQSGISVVSVFIAINNGKDKDGNDRGASFPKVYVYGTQAENLKKYCHKGSKIAIEGKIDTSNYQKEDGTKIYETFIVANKVEFLDSKQSDSYIPEPNNIQNMSNSQIVEQVMTESNDPFKEFSEEVVLTDSDLPF